MFPGRLQELLQAHLCFLRSFCFARIRLDPLGGQVLHHDCISMIVSRFTTFTENFVICCNQITKIFCTKYGSANASSARNPCNFWSSGRSRNFGLSGSEYKHCVYPNPHFSQALKIVHEKNWRVSLCVQELYDPQESLWILAAIPVCRNDKGLPVLARDPHFYLVLVGLVNNSSEVSEEYGSLRSCLSTRSLDTITGWWSISHGYHLSCLSTLSHDTVEDVMGGEVDELEEELVDKPGTTIGTKFSVLHCIRIPF